LSAGRETKGAGEETSEMTVFMHFWKANETQTAHGTEKKIGQQFNYGHLSESVVYPPPPARELKKRNICQATVELAWSTILILRNTI
jgi:hypothetical protein